MSAEYILSEGNFKRVALRAWYTDIREHDSQHARPECRSGPQKPKTHLPVVVDPTHGIGLREFVPAMALAAVAAGADSIMIEVHNAPEQAKSDGRTGVASRPILKI